MTLESVRMNRLTLAFDDAMLEKEFLGEFADNARTQLRVVWLLAALGFLGLWLADENTAVMDAARVARYSIVGPTLAFGVTSTFASPPKFRAMYGLVTTVVLCELFFIVPAQMLLPMLRVPSWREAEGGGLGVLQATAMAGQMLVIFGVFAVSHVRLWTLVPSA